MTRFSNVDQLLKKLARPAQKVGKMRIKVPWRRRTSSKRGIKLTTAERQEQKDKCETKRVNLDEAVKEAREEMFKRAEAMSEQFGGTHKPEYYYSLIMQKSNLKVKEQAFSRWNVFVSRETRNHNDALGVGAGQRVSSGFIKELSVRWREMSDEQKEAATADGIEELEERHKNKKEGTQNVLIKSFHDTRATLGSVQRELEFLAGRTGLRIVRATYNGGYNQQGEQPMAVGNHPLYRAEARWAAALDERPKGGRRATAWDQCARATITSRAHG